MRYIIALIVGFAVAGSLFLLMRGFINGDTPTIAKSQNEVQLTSFVQAPEEMHVRHKERHTLKKPEPKQPPPAAPEVNVKKSTDVKPTNVDIKIPNINTPIPGAGGSGPVVASGGYNVSNLSANGQAIPLVAVRPTYPVRAKLDHTEGYVTVEFTIQPDGSATDPEVIEAHPRHVFNRAAISALLRSKFKPKVVNGKPVASRATYTYEFHLPGGK